MNIKKYLKILPGYAYVPLLFGVLFNFIGYFGIQKIMGNLPQHSLAIPLDYKIPFVPEFVYIYIGAYVQWIIGFMMCGRESKEFCYRYMSGEFWAKLISFIIFIILPTTIVRPEVTEGGVTGFLMNFVYNSDAPINLFPSIHCLESWFCFRAAMSQKRCNGIYRVIMGVSSILVFMSVVMVKQHVLVDIIGGILILEIGLYISNRLNLSRFYEMIDKIICKITQVKND